MNLGFVCFVPFPHPPVNCPQSCNIIRRGQALRTTEPARLYRPFTVSLSMCHEVLSVSDGAFMISFIATWALVLLLGFADVHFFGGRFTADMACSLRGYIYSSVESASSLLRQYKALTWILMDCRSKSDIGQSGPPLSLRRHDQIDGRSNPIELPDEGSGEVNLCNDLIARPWYSVRHSGWAPMRYSRWELLRLLQYCSRPFRVSCA